MSKETKLKTDSSEAGQGLSGAAPVAQRASGGPVSAAEPSVGPLGPGQRWSLARRRDVSLRLLRGESVDALSRELGVEAYRLEEWHRRALSGIDASLRVRTTSAYEVELNAAMRRVGELTMQNELLRHRLGEVKIPLAPRRSK
jgi:transposase